MRLQTAQWFARGEASAVIAKDLRVSVRSVQRWRQAWEEGGPSALGSQGPASLPRLSDEQFTQLEAGLSKGPAAHGWGTNAGPLVA
ncbi:helix-turn-helix domain-containing protein [Streptomyces mirabilis]|uniref:helix-turn-helix domain-containing protein n=1 Tax=Streptomyces mirabilis TaxID=68239 RepID=UPI0036949925